MKTNLVDLMSRVSQLEREYSELSYELRGNSMNLKTIELDGTAQVLEEYPNFEGDFRRFLDIGKEITRLKGIMFAKNNSITLENGDTIQKALVNIQNKRKALELVKTLARQNPSKRRNTEVNNSYFTSKELAYDKNMMIELEQSLIEEIQYIELQISEANSQSFKIEM